MTTTAIDLLIDASKSASNLREIRDLQKQIKQQMLEIGDEGGENFDRLAAASAQLEDRLGDVRDRINQMNPDKFSALDSAARLGAAGIQVVTGAMSLFGDQSEDTQKALLKVQAAMAFAQGISQVKDLGKEFENLWKIVRANPIAAIATALVAVGTAAFAVYKAFTQTSEATKELNKQYEKQKEITSELVAQYENEIKILEAQGNQEEKIFEVKKAKIAATIEELKVSAELHKSKVQDILDNDDLYESYLRTTEAVFRKIGADEEADKIDQLIKLNKKERAKEDFDAFKKDAQMVKDLQADLTALTITEDNRRAEAGKKSRDEEIKNLSAHDQHRLDLQNEYLAKKKAAEEAELERRRLAREKELADELAWQQAVADMEAEITAKEAEAAKAFEDSKKKNDEDERERRRAILEQTSILFGQLSELTKKNAKASKGFAIAQATIDTYLSATKALATLPPPASYIAAAASLVQGFLMVRKIATTEPGSNSGGAGMGLTASFSANAAIVNQEPAGAQPTTPLDANGNPITQQQNQAQNQQPIPAYVVESQAQSARVRTIALQQNTEV